jgi:predicted DCC family thiol-disulfide oxidoreductase YuxK
MLPRYTSLMLTVVYDADCGVCQASVGWLRRRGSFDFVGDDAPLPAGVTRDETGHTVVVLDEGRKYVRAAAVARLLRELRGYRWMAPLLTAPGLRALADFGYDRFAAHRHRISAALGLRACPVVRAPAPLRSKNR